MGLAATKVYCLYIDTETQKKFIKMHNGYKVDKFTYVCKDEKVIKIVDALSGLLIAKYNTTNMSEAIRLYLSDTTLRDNLKEARQQENYTKVCEETKSMIADYLSGVLKDKE